MNKDDALLHLLGAMSMGSSEYIEQLRATDPPMAVGESESFSESAATLWQSLQA